MVGSGEAESRAIAGAVRSAIAAAHLDAGANITGLLIDMGCAHDVDFRRHFLCWQLTRVLSPSLTEMVPPAVVRRLAKQKAARWPVADPGEGGSGVCDAANCFTGA